MPLSIIAASVTSGRRTNLRGTARSISGSGDPSRCSVSPTVVPGSPRSRFFTSSTLRPLSSLPSMRRILSPGRTPSSNANPSSAPSTSTLPPSPEPIVKPTPPYRPVVRKLRSSACCGLSYAEYGSSVDSIAFTPVWNSLSMSTLPSTYAALTFSRIAPKSTARSSTSPLLSSTRNSRIACPPAKTELKTSKTASVKPDSTCSGRTLVAASLRFWGSCCSASGPASRAVSSLSPKRRSGIRNLGGSGTGGGGGRRPHPR
mmetsp:Transcript_3646/g.9558  ORF Transcript_3646/g.9558 Transcript_3646/m.9558 type:complete len:259 (+) Transcript_3646:505-1281(+)